MGAPRPTFTLSELARRLDVPQHQLIHLCEKEVVVPELQDAQGRGSSREFSERNFLELALALRLRAAQVPVAAVRAILQVMRGLEARLARELEGFALPTSLREDGAPDLRVIVSDGSTVFFSLGVPGGEAKLFGGIPLDQVTGDRPGRVKPVQPAASEPSRDRGTNGAFGGPEGSRFVRLELSVTEVARAMPLD